MEPSLRESSSPRLLVIVASLLLGALTWLAVDAIRSQLGEIPCFGDAWSIELYAHGPRASVTPTPTTPKPGLIALHAALRSVDPPISPARAWQLLGALAVLLATLTAGLHGGLTGAVFAGLFLASWTPFLTGLLEIRAEVPLVVCLLASLLGASSLSPDKTSRIRAATGGMFLFLAGILRPEVWGVSAWLLLASVVRARHPAGGAQGKNLFWMGIIGIGAAPSWLLFDTLYFGSPTFSFQATRLYAELAGFPLSPQAFPVLVDESAKLLSAAIERAAPGLLILGLLGIGALRPGVSRPLVMIVGGFFIAGALALQFSGIPPFARFFDGFLALVTVTAGALCGRFLGGRFLGGRFPGGHLLEGRSPGGSPDGRVAWAITLAVLVLVGLSAQSGLRRFAGQARASQAESHAFTTALSRETATTKGLILVDADLGSELVARAFIREEKLRNLQQYLRRADPLDGVELIIIDDRHHAPPSGTSSHPRLAAFLGKCQEIYSNTARSIRILRLRPEGS
ncbi:MAG: hypothetical protein AB1486_07720 [Planctomycetota bacterium]